jgi:hypothetical protein
MIPSVALVLLAATTEPTYAGPKMIGVNFTGYGDSGNNGLYVQGPTTLAATDLVNEQVNWNNVSTYGGSIHDNFGNPAGSVSISCEQQLEGSRYGGTGGFPDPTGNPLNILYNGLVFGMNHGTISVTLTGPSPKYDMCIFGSVGTVTIYTNGVAMVTSTNSMGAFETPSMVSVRLPATDETRTYTFGEHGNYDTGGTPAYDWSKRTYQPLISACQFKEVWNRVEGAILVVR